MKPFTFFLLVFLLAACTTVTSEPSPTPSPQIMETPAPVTIELDQPFQLRVGQRGILGEGDLTLELQTILRDWRCPTQVECSEAGAVDVAIYAWLPGMEPTRFEPSTNPPFNREVTPFDIYDIRLVAVDPHPETPEHIIPMEDYRVTFIVSLRSE